MMRITKKIISKAIITIFAICLLVAAATFLFSAANKTTYVNALASNNIIEISTSEDFIALSENESISNENITIILSNDLDFSNVEYKTIGNPSRKLSANFDGNGFALKNITLDTATSIFSNIDGALIKNLRIINTLVTSSSDKFLFCDTMNNGTIENVALYNSENISIFNNAAALVESATNCTFNNFAVSIKYYTRNNKIVSLIKNAYTCSFTNCYFINYHKNNINFVENSTNVTIKNCYYCFNNKIYISNNNMLFLSDDFSKLENPSMFTFNTLVYNGKMPYLKNVKPYLDVPDYNYYLNSLPNINNVTIENEDLINNALLTVTDYINLGFDEYKTVTTYATNLLERIKIISKIYNDITTNYNNIKNDILINNYDLINENLMAYKNYLNNYTNNQKEVLKEIENNIESNILIKKEFIQIKENLVLINLNKDSCFLELNNIYSNFNKFKNSLIFTETDNELLKEVEDAINFKADTATENIVIDLDNCTTCDLDKLNILYEKILEITKLDLFNIKLTNFCNEISLRINTLTSLLNEIKKINEIYNNFTDYTKITSADVDTVLQKFNDFLNNEYVSNKIVTSIKHKISKLNIIKTFQTKFNDYVNQTDYIYKFVIYDMDDFYIIDEATDLKYNLENLYQEYSLSSADKLVISELISIIERKLVVFNFDKNMILDYKNNSDNDNTNGDTIPDKDNEIDNSESSGSSSTASLYRKISTTSLSIGIFTMLCLVIFCIITIIKYIKFKKSR